MKDLRKHLDAAKREYESARYPGDLGAEILGHRQTRTRGWWAVATVFAAAAAVALALWLNRSDTYVPGDRMIAQDTQSIEINDPETTEEEVAMTDMPAITLPEIPEQFEFAPVSPDFSFAVPSFSFLEEEVSQQDSSNKQESVL